MSLIIAFGVEAFQLGKYVFLEDFQSYQFCRFLVATLIEVNRPGFSETWLVECYLKRLIGMIAVKHPKDWCRCTKRL